MFTAKVNENSTKHAQLDESLDWLAEAPYIKRCLQSNIKNVMIKISISLINDFTIQTSPHVKCYSASGCGGQHVSKS
jgi:protein subunit release factor B